MSDPSYYGRATQKSGGNVGIDHGKIFVGGLSWQTTEESLRWHFEQYGPVFSVEVMRDRITGDPRGFAFVVFKEASAVDLVMAEASHEINHKVVDVKRAQARGVAPPSIHDKKDTTTPAGSGNTEPNPLDMAGVDQTTGQRNDMTPEQQGSKVFVGGIPPNVDKEELQRIFEEFGPVVDAIVMIDQATNRSRCFGFVTFKNGSNGAEKAIQNQPLNIQGRHVEVKLATPKAEQRKNPPSAGPKHVGLRAGISNSSSGKFAGLAVSYGRNGWKAGYGTYAFGEAGFAVTGWETYTASLRRGGFSFAFLKDLDSAPPPKRSRQS